MWNEDEEEDDDDDEQEDDDDPIEYLSPCCLNLFDERMSSILKENIFLKL